MKEPVKLTDAAITDQLRDQLLDGCSVGFAPGSLVKTMVFPGCNMLVTLGLLEENHNNIIEKYLRAALKWLNNQRLNITSDVIVFGRITPGSQGLIIVHLYKSYGEAANELPKYCSGIATEIGNFCSFTTTNGTFTYKRSSTTNELSV